ncbi:MAG: hypothetical protein QOJ07_2424 [Thermoleophilaceae bacterium]|nr:hypothetical protein [Thermoleophilaceae bacterium]
MYVPADMRFLTVVDPTRVPGVIGERSAKARDTLPAAGFEVQEHDVSSWSAMCATWGA